MNNRGTLAYVLVYVDDIIITGNRQTAIDNIVNQLSSTFAIKDLGRLHYFLRIEAVHHSKDLILSQQKYLLNILQRSGLSDCKPMSSPMCSSQVLTIDDSLPLSDPVRYCQVVGALQYATLSRPDIAFAMNRVCQFMNVPTENHWSAVKRILCYSKWTTIWVFLFITHRAPPCRPLLMSIGKTNPQQSRPSLTLIGRDALSIVDPPGGLPFILDQISSLGLLVKNE
ncbi:uncharacterized mitochondrial protein AtMg00810-like [Helianthus annuus]|uniref:uncharacterized mitochondrial protein AtMg00810-like n=1 Tax=Helianthus annuus TaxID=4232 RepID=UPI000B9091C6|nr:uncharacterized mitochondrial protein AtMg00810-like [Helianthus annuus]